MDTRIRKPESFELSFLGGPTLNQKAYCDGVRDSFDTLQGPEGLTKPVSLEKAYASFGLLLGMLPMLSVFCIMATGIDAGPNSFFRLLWLLASLATGLFGYLLGGRAARLERRLASCRLSWYLSCLPFVGIAWGAASGALGGLFLFLIGSIFGAVVGGAIGLFAVTPFAILVRILSQDEHVEQKHLLPIALGIPTAVAAFWLGL